MKRYICYFLVEEKNGKGTKESYFAKKEYSAEECIEDMLFWARINRKRVLLNTIRVQCDDEPVYCYE